MTDPVTAPELATALLTSTADQRAGLAAAVRRSQHDPDGGTMERCAFAGQDAAPSDPARAAALAAALLERACRRPELLAELSRWSRQVTAVRGPSAHANTVGGGARITGMSVQARDISGGIHFHTAHPASTLPVPRQLLPVPAHFVDRDRDAAALDRLRLAQLVVVSGLAGVGKTTFVSHWLHRVRGHFPDGQLYADLRGHAPGSPASPGEVLGRFLRAYGVTSTPVDLAEQAALWRSLAVELRIAVMLDNAVSAAQVRPLLFGAPDSLVVVVSRRRLTGLTMDGAAFHELGLLGTSAAVELLTSRIGAGRVAREQEAAHEVAALCGGLPLAVCLAGARMAARPRQSVASMVDALSRDGGRLSALRAEGRWAVRAALDESYKSLPARVAHGYRCLGTQPVTVICTDAVAAACALSRDDADALLDELVEANLIEDLGADRFRFHDLVRLHAAQRAEEDPPAARQESVRRVVDWYLSAATAAEELLTPNHRTLRRTYAFAPEEPPMFPDGAAALEWLTVEQPQLEVAVSTAVEHGWDDTAWMLVDALWPLFHRIRPHRFWIEAHETGLAAARRAGDPRGVSRMLTTGGGGLLNAGRNDEALDWFGQALQDALRDGDRRARSQALHGIGQAHQMSGRLDAARETFTEALRLREEIGYPRGVALSAPAWARSR